MYAYNIAKKVPLLQKIRIVKIVVRPYFRLVWQFDCIPEVIFKRVIEKVTRTSFFYGVAMLIMGSQKVK